MIHAERLSRSGLICVKAMREASSMRTWTNFPADASASALAFAAAGDAVTDAVKALEFLDVDVDQSAGIGIFITAHRLGRFEVLHAAQTGAFQHPADGRR